MGLAHREPLQAIHSRAPREGTIRYGSAAGWGVLAATVLGSGVAFLDQTVVNVALPSIGRALDADVAGLQWTVDAYLLTLSALLLPGGALGDHFGQRRVFVIGLVWFALASALCGFAGNVLALTAARAFQGIGGALLVPGSLAIIRRTFHPDDQAQAVGAWSGLSGVTTALGPLLGGWLVDVGSWRWVFFINLPLAAIAIAVAQRGVPRCEGEGRAALDLPGAGLAALGLGGVVYALIEGPVHGFAPRVIAAAVLGVGGLVAFLLRERFARAPMLPLAIFSSAQFSGANAVTLAVYFALGGATFLLVLMLQTVVGYSAAASGASLLPLTALMFVLSPRVGKWSQVHGFRLPMTVGPIVAACGLALFTGIAPGRSYVSSVLPGVLFLGLGLSLTVAPLTSAVLTAAEERFAGIASGVNNAVARIAGLLAVALLPGIAGVAGAKLSDPGAFAAGFGRAIWVSAVICAVGGAIAWFTVPGRARQLR